MTLNWVLPRYESGLCSLCMFGSTVDVGSCTPLNINLSAIEVCSDTPWRTRPVRNLGALAGMMNLCTLLLARVYMIVMLVMPLPATYTPELPRT